MLPLTLYTLLGVSQDASDADIRKAYRQRALATHPDKVDPGAPEALRHAAEGRFRQVCAAFETLSDPIRRRAYDLSLRPMPSLPQAPAMPPRQPSNFDEQSEQLMKSRQEWASQNEEKQRERMRATSSRTQSSASLKSVKSPTMSRASSMLSETNTSAPKSPPALSGPIPARPRPSPPASRTSSMDSASNVSQPTRSPPAVDIPIKHPIPVPTSPTQASTSAKPAINSSPVTSRSPTVDSNAEPSSDPGRHTKSPTDDTPKRPWYSRDGSSTRAYYTKKDPLSSASTNSPWYARRTTTGNTTPSSSETVSQPVSPAEPPTPSPVKDRPLPKEPLKVDLTKTSQWETFAELAKDIDAGLLEGIDQRALADKIFYAMQARMPQWEDRRRDVGQKRVMA